MPEAEQLRQSSALSCYDETAEFGQLLLILRQLYTDTDR